MEMFKNEISRLKCEKLDLARQNVVSCYLVTESYVIHDSFVIFNLQTSVDVPTNILKLV